MSLRTDATNLNRLIAALPQADQRRALGHCETVELSLGQVLMERGERCRQVYFPTRSFVSSVAGSDDREQIEVGLVGDEGMVGASLLLGVDASPVQALVQGAGPALRMRADAFVRELERSPALRRSVGRYLFVLMDQVTQSAMCVRYHLAEARLARWLLMMRDRAHADTFHITHEFLGYMLAVRRAGVTKIAHGLADQGVIEYRRGEVTILDRTALKEASCDCYEQSIRMYTRAMSTPVLRSRKPNNSKSPRRAHQLHRSLDVGRPALFN